MSIFIVGADHLGNIPEKLGRLGYTTIKHLKGRKRLMDKQIHIPSDTVMVLLLTDYIDHNIARVIKQKAKNKMIPIIYAKRSWTEIFSRLECLA